MHQRQAPVFDLAIPARRRIKASLVGRLVRDKRTGWLPSRQASIFGAQLTAPNLAAPT